METEQLRHLESIARFGTMSEAAAQMHITQPALSRSIKRLEADLGCALFDRTKNSVTMNEAGRLVAELGRDVLLHEQALRDEISELLQQARTIRVGTCAPTPLWRLTAQMVERFPGELLSPRMLSDREIEEGVFDGSLDLGIARRPFGLPTISSVPFMTETLSVSVPEGHPLANRESLSFSELAGEQFLQYEDVGFWLDVVRNAIPDAKFVLQHDYYVFKELATSTKALFFVTDAPSLAIEANGRKVIPLRDSTSSATYYLIARNDARDAICEMLKISMSLQLLGIQSETCSHDCKNH